VRLGLEVALCALGEVCVDFDAGHAAVLAHECGHDGGVVARAGADVNGVFAAFGRGGGEQVRVE
jgi:hypothetical protein